VYIGYRDGTAKHSPGGIHCAFL